MSIFYNSLNLSHPISRLTYCNHFHLSKCICEDGVYVVISGRLLSSDLAVQHDVVRIEEYRLPAGAPKNHLHQGPTSATATSSGQHRPLQTEYIGSKRSFHK